MKNINILFVAVLLIISTSFKLNKSLNTSSGKENVEVIFNHKLTFNDVVKLKLDLSEKGLTLTYRKLIFDENSKLTAIDFSVKSTDGYAGGADEANLTDDSRVGFRRTYTKDSKVKFVCGVILP